MNTFEKKNSWTICRLSLTAAWLKILWLTKFFLLNFQMIPLIQIVSLWDTSETPSSKWCKHNFPFKMRKCHLFYKEKSKSHRLYKVIWYFTHWCLFDVLFPDSLSALMCEVGLICGNISKPLTISTLWPNGTSLTEPAVYFEWG